MIIIATILFILLSPGLIVTFPPGGKGIWSTEETSNIAVLVASAAFFLILKLTDKNAPGFKYLKNIQNEITDKSNF